VTEAVSYMVLDHMDAYESVDGTWQINGALGKLSMSICPLSSIRSIAIDDDL
jgi:hypothetical protein